jgi:hypothetical protein
LFDINFRPKQTPKTPSTPVRIPQFRIPSADFRHWVAGDS